MQGISGIDAPGTIAYTEGNLLKDASSMAMDNSGEVNAGKNVMPESTSNASSLVLFKNTSIESTAFKALQAAGLSIEESANIYMIKSMMENGMSIDKNSILNMNQVINNFQGKDISTLVEMQSLKIPITESNIEQYTNYKNYEHQISGDIQNIIEELPDAYNELIALGDNKSAANLYGGVLKLFLPENQEAVMLKSPQNDNSGVINPDTNSTGEAVNTQNPKTSLEGLQNFDFNMSQANMTAESEGSEGTKSAASQMKFLGGNLAEIEIETEISNNENLRSEESTGNLNSNGDSNLVATPEKQALLNDIQNEFQNIKYSNIELSDSFVNLLKRIGISEETINGYINNLADKNGKAITSETLMREIAQIFEDYPPAMEGESKIFNKLFSSNEYNQIMKDAISNQWLLKPSDVEKKENVDALYNRLNQQSKILTQAISDSAGASAKIMANINNLHNNMDFMNQINNMFAYVQLPLKMANQNAHGDLYVYRNKKGQKNDDGSVSAILHLDMDHLGPLDVYVKLKDNNVKTNFYVADDSVIDLINDNIDVLNSRLQNRGYSMTSEMFLHEDLGVNTEDAPITEMLDTDKIDIVSMQSFDARA